MNQQSKLYMVGVPIGNFDDMTYRGVQTLQMVDMIYCEDTRVTKKLLNHFSIDKPLKSYHTFNENEITNQLLDLIKEGKNVAVVSDAGMPIISDPGFLAVREAIQNDVDVVVIPGPSAFVTALVGSGISSNRILFTGFLNSGDNKRKKELEKLKDKEETLILYESPHRIKETLEMLAELMPTRHICLARELTKTYEEYLHGTPSEILDVVSEIKGEMVIVIEGATNQEIKSKWIDAPLVEHMAHYMEQGYTERDAMKLVAKDRGISKSIIYQQLKKK
ncbi:MAG: 16S rRNA (cytidine(1402)-2'-O)-methyltransferase [Staphylococcus sp.]|nr:16S rRNA (cytidine(1402)-2'-O)-methyltransferase [Staphylococcus sp.]